MSPNHSNSDIEKQSRELAQTFGWAYWLTAFWLFASVSYLPLKRFGAALVTPEQDALEAAAAFGDLLIEHLPVILAMVAVYTARKLFVQFSRGEIFTPQNGVSLTKVGDWLILSAATALFLPIILAGSENGEAIDWAGSYFAIVMILIGLAIRLFGRTFALAADIKADNDQMV